MEGFGVVVVGSSDVNVDSAVVVLGSELEAVEGPFDIIFEQSIFKEQIKLIAEQSTKAYCKCMLIFEKYQTLIICFLVH